MRVSRITYGRGFAISLGPTSFASTRAYREVTIDLDHPDDDPAEAQALAQELVETQIDGDFDQQYKIEKV